MPVDVIVVSHEHVEKCGGVQGTVTQEALREGRVLVGP
jgi:alkyl sulfatase BDS1-like metallo-beta-lactamase superfamily hydrolase